jgi:hypothetical protein
MEAETYSEIPADIYQAAQHHVSEHNCSHISRYSSVSSREFWDKAIKEASSWQLAFLPFGSEKTSVERRRQIS